MIPVVISSPHVKINTDSYTTCKMEWNYYCNESTVKHVHFHDDVSFYTN
jgi:hypothetical protein